MKLSMIILSFLLLPVLAKADMFTPSPSCHKPIKPYKFTQQYEVDSYNNDLDRYKRCIDNFISEQKDAANNHKEAINNAIEEWNRFVRYQ